MSSEENQSEVDQMDRRQQLCVCVCVCLSDARLMVSHKHSGWRTMCCSSSLCVCVGSSFHSSSRHRWSQRTSPASSFSLKEQFVIFKKSEQHISFMSVTLICTQCGNRFGTRNLHLRWRQAPGTNNGLCSGGGSESGLTGGKGFQV